MNKKHLFVAAFALAACVAAFAQTIDAAWFGRWEGLLTMGDAKLGPTNSISLNVFKMGVLVDLPSSKMYGFPARPISSDAKRLECAMVLNDQNAMLKLAKTADGATGTLEISGASIPVKLVYSSYQPDPAKQVSFPMAKGKLPGTLEYPTGAKGKVPLVIIISGSGPADRDGNAFTVPGRNDALKQLAYALRDGGVASYRYDKRGAGEAFWMVKSEGELVFKDYVDDAVACIKFFRADKRFSKLVVLGYTEGALVGAAATAQAKVDGFVACAATSEYIGDILLGSIKEAEEPYRSEGLVLVDSLKAGRAVKSVSEYYEASILRVSNQQYMISWLRYPPAAVFGAVKAPSLLVWGDMDMQVTLYQFEQLCAMMPTAQNAMVPGMNHVLKAVSPDVKQNFAAFSDPSFALAEGLAPTIIEFVSELP